MRIKLGNKIITKTSPTYFIADIAANHDGNLSRAKKLIRLCAKAGANAAKFQHFKAQTIVSDKGFKNLDQFIDFLFFFLGKLDDHGFLDLIEFEDCVLKFIKIILKI